MVPCPMLLMRQDFQVTRSVVQLVSIFVVDVFPRLAFNYELVPEEVSSRQTNHKVAIPVYSQRRKLWPAMLRAEPLIQQDILTAGDSTTIQHEPGPAVLPPSQSILIQFQSLVNLDASYF